MCGIWASIGLPWHPRSIDLVSHRGPDASGFEQFATPIGPLVLAHRRLAIVDRTRGSDQPFADRARNAWITFNGEILNHEEIGQTLERSRHGFATRSDTEVLLVALGEQGLAALDTFRGFFAFVTVDFQKREVLAARDRFGIKPLYLWRGARGALAFASEIKQFLAIPEFRARLDRSALRDYLTLGLFDHGRSTFFRDVEQIRPGSAIRIRLAAPIRVEEINWAPPLARYSQESQPGSPARLRELLAQATELNLRGDAPIAVALSGGIDSSAIAGLAASARGATRVTKAVGVMFPDTEIAEEHHARAVAARHGLSWHSTTVDTSQLVDLFLRVIWHFDEPIARSSMLAQLHLFATIASTGARVALTGQAADELLGGYPFTIPITLFELALRDGLWSATAELGRAGVDAADVRRGLTTAIAPRMLLEQAFARLDGAGSWGLRPRLAAHLDPALARLRIIASRTEARHAPLRSPSARIARALVNTSLPMLLHYEDRASMAFGVEARPVLLQPEIVEGCLAVGARARLQHGQTKSLLRAAVDDLLPLSVRNRTDKLGFPAPEAAWERSSFGSWLRARALEAIESAPQALASVIDLDATRVLLSQQRRGVPLWALASLGVWMQRFNVSD